MTLSRRGEPAVRQVPPPPDSRAGVSYSRFIPREELQGFAAWMPGAFADLPRDEPSVPFAELDRAGAADDRQDWDDAVAAANAAAADPLPAHERDDAPDDLRVAEVEALAAEAEAERQQALRSELALEFEQRLASETATQVQAARHQGYQDGYRDGLQALESFKESHARQLSGQIGLMLQSFDTELQALEQRLAVSVSRVATELARQVVRSELAIRPALVVQVAQEAVAALLQSARLITVQVHPEDHALVAQGCEEMFSARGARLSASPAIERGGCRVESDAGTIDACVAARWTQATQALGTGVGWSDADQPGGDA